MEMYIHLLTPYSVPSSTCPAIGNVTGSNAVNVFLGLGLPWLIASIYWELMGPNDLWKSKYVHTMFTCCATDLSGI